jgi:two-component system nitrogen regulation sensor histidine kinase NtrY
LVDAVSQKPGIMNETRRPRLRFFAPILVVLSVVLAGVTFAILTGSTAIIPTRDVVVRLVTLNAGAVLTLMVLIGLEVRKILRARQERRAGARLHTRILALFSLIAAVPAVLVAIVATLTLDRGLDRWFSERTQSMVDFSLVVARAYLDEYRQVLNVELTAVASELDRSKPFTISTRSDLPSTCRTSPRCVRSPTCRSSGRTAWKSCEQTRALLRGIGSRTPA